LRGGTAPRYKEGCTSEFKSFYKTVNGNEGEKCNYSTRLDLYGCGCFHNCDYCYARSLLSFRGLWDEKNPRIADIDKVRRKIRTIKPGSIVRLGGMTDCFQPCERAHHVTYQAIEALNQQQVGYLIVTKSHLVAEPEYLELFDKHLAHIQVSVTTLDDGRSASYERASPPSKRIEAIYKLQEQGFDVAIRLSPLIEDFIDFDKLNALEIGQGLVEFLRVNAWVRRWMSGVDFSKYTYHQSGYDHLPLEEKIRILDRIRFGTITVCDDVTEHYQYFKEHVNPNREDCCNLRFI